MKGILASIVISLLPALLPIILLLFLFGGMGAVASAPVQPPCTPEKAEHYGMVCSELGAPWEIVLLADAYWGEQNGEKDIENVHPVHTAMEFLVLKEDLLRYEITHYRTEYDTDSEGNTTSHEEPVYEWVTIRTTTYEGEREIINYIGNLTSEDLENISASVIISKAQAKAAEKTAASPTDGDGNPLKYVIRSLSVNSNYREVLKEFINLNDENIEKVMDLFESHYIAHLYFGDAFIYINAQNYVLPEIITGNVSRQDLVRVAQSLLGLPYQWGGKSNQAGIPTNGLDCSGFVDWVYYQCFGAAVNGAVNTPDNIVLNGTAIQYYSSAPIDLEEDELQIGDLGFYHDPADVVDYNHVGIYIGKIDGEDAIIHAGGSSFGTDDSPTGRVGISINIPGRNNSKNPITGETFEPAMKGTNFKYFRRPQFEFNGSGN